MKTILLLDDELGLLRLLGSVLKKQYIVIEATTAEKALRTVIEDGREVDLLIADLSLPKSSGVQVALLLRSEIPELAVIITSGYPLNAWAERDSHDLASLGSGAVMVIQKPFPAKALLSAVGELLSMPMTAAAKPV